MFAFKIRTNTRGNTWASPRILLQCMRRSNSTVIGSKPDSSLTALDPWLQNPSETLRRDVKMFERIYRTGGSEMQGKRGQISPSNIVWVAWNAGSRLFFRSSAKLGFQPAQNGSTSHISLRFNRKNEQCTAMSFFPGKDPALGDARASDAIEQVIVPRSIDLGDFRVHRALPSAQPRWWGRSSSSTMPDRPCFVLPRRRRAAASAYRARDRHLFIRWRDRASRQPRHRAADPAGRGQLDDGRAWHRAFRTHGPTARRWRALARPAMWVALPAAGEETAPAFAHTAAADIPELNDNGMTLRVIVGTMHGLRSPVATSWGHLIRRCTPQGGDGTAY